MNKFEVISLQRKIDVDYMATYSIIYFIINVNYNNSLFTVRIIESEDRKCGHKSYINKINKTLHSVTKDGKNIVNDYISSLPKNDRDRQKIENFRDEIIDFCIDYIEQKEIEDIKNKQQHDKQFSESIIRLL